MEIIVSIIMVTGSLLAMVSGIWVAFALGNAISTRRKKKVPFDSKTESWNK